MADDKNDKPMSALERYLAKQKAEKARAQSAAPPPPKDKSRLFARAEAQAQAYADSKNKPSQKAAPTDSRAKPVFGPGERPSLAGIERPEPLQPPTLSRWESVAESRLSESESETENDRRAREAGAPVAPPSHPSQTVYTPIEDSSEIHDRSPIDEWRPITDSTLAADGIQNADFGVRLIAAFIDGAIIFCLDFIAKKVLFAVLGLTLGGRMFDGLDWLAYLLLIYSYYGYFYSVKGASPGKMLLGLEVTGLDGVTRLTPWRAFFREAIGKFISAVPFLMGYIIVMIRLDHRALHDLLFDTRVVRKRGGA